MEIYALYGPSGTGKSTSALALAHKHRIDAIIDDGILIFKGKKIAGKSAKYEKMTVQAVKRAIFFWKEHAEEVKQAIDQQPIQRLLILGTSQNMVDRIQRTLELPPIHHYLNITDVRSSAEIKAAIYDRGMMGRHVIPIPRVQVEQDFMGRLKGQMDRFFSTKKGESSDTTIVHPRFHRGRIQVSEQALKRLVINSCREVPEVWDIHKVMIDFTSTPRLNVDLEIRLRLGDSILTISNQILQHIYTSFEHSLELELEKINLKITGLKILS